MQVKNYLLILLTIPLFSGCFSLFDPEPKVTVQTQYIERKIPTVDHPKPVSLSNVKIYVVTKDNYDEFVKNFEKKNGELVYVALSIKDYENLSLNMAELRRYINQQKEVILYYEKAVSPTKTQDEKTDKK